MPIQEPSGFSLPLWLAGPSWPTGHPVRIGVPLPRGSLRREEWVRLVDAEGRLVRLQTEVLARWPDESIQWLLLDFWAYKSGPERQTWHVQLGRVGHGEQMYPTPGLPDGWPASPSREEAMKPPLPEKSGGTCLSGPAGTSSLSGPAGTINVPLHSPPHPASASPPPVWPARAEAMEPPHPCPSPAEWRGDEAPRQPACCADHPLPQWGGDPLTRPAAQATLSRSGERGGGGRGEAMMPPQACPSPPQASGDDTPAIRIEDQGPVLWVDTGPVQFGLDQRRLRPIRWVRLKTAASLPAHPKANPPRRPAVEPVAQLQTQLELAGGRVREAVIEGWRVESVGPVRLTLRADGRWPRCKGLRVRARLSFFAGSGLVCYRLTVHNPRRARHRGGLWDLGDPGSVLLEDLSVLLRWNGQVQKAAVRTQPNGPSTDLSETLRQGVWRLYQDSSGGPNWQSRNHLNRHGRVPCRLPGYEVCILPHSAGSQSPPQSRPLAAEGRGDAVPPQTVSASPQPASPAEGRGDVVPPHPVWPLAKPPSPAEGRGDVVPPQPAGHLPGLPLRPGQRQESRRALPVGAVETDRLRAVAAAPEFWQQFPKTFEIGPEYLRVGLWPAEWDDLHELQGGERKTHTLWFHFEPVASSGQQPVPRGPEELADLVDRLAWVHEPIQVVLPPQVWAQAGVLPHFVPAGAESARRLDEILEEAIAGPDSLLERREIIDEYGWRHYGDLYADHENAHYPGPKPVISHYNNQFDVIYGAILQEARTGNPAWRSVYDPLARHVMDIDLYHTQEDRPAYNGGLFWPTDHYRSAETATHRTYSRANLPPDGSPYGGGPGPEHNYATGLLYYYWLTGDRDAREAVVQLADWVLAMDDGSRTPWGIFDAGPTGLASATRSPDYHGPGRGAANSIQTLLDAWLATGQRKYLAKAEELIRRSIHPADRIEEHRLLDAENRWSYTMYLAALARYLDLKIQNEQLDSMYRYGLAALVHYAAWMVEHEQPYLDRPEQLEYITEAWPVQELRKANAMRLAARYAPEPLRSRLFQRAAELADRAWQDWARFPTRTSTRAVAVLLVEGVRDAYYRQQQDPPAPQIAGPKQFGWPEPFVPQRERVRRLFRRPGGWFRLVGALVQPAHWVRLIGTLWRYRN